MPFEPKFVRRLESAIGLKFTLSFGSNGLQTLLGNPKDKIPTLEKSGI